MIKRSTAVAMGGLASALCLLLMFLTGMIPFATFALPAVAGMVLIAVVTENGYKTAVMVYVSVSIMSIFIVPDREAAIMFIGFFGYYTILKGKLEKIKINLLRMLIKYLIFNVAVIISYTIIIYIFGINDIIEEIGLFGKFTTLVMLIMGNIVFTVYDIALSRLIFAYINWFRPNILRKLK